MKNEISEEIRQELEKLKEEYEKCEAERGVKEEETENENDESCLNCAFSSYLIKFHKTIRGIYYCGLKDKIVSDDFNCRKWRRKNAE